jgi:thiol-disulfide isomerase/thioredoxin
MAVMARLLIRRQDSRGRHQSAAGSVLTVGAAALACAIGLAGGPADSARAAPAAPIKVQPLKPPAALDAKAGRPGQPPAAGKRAEKDVLTDLAAADKAIDGYLFENLIEERLRPWFQQQMVSMFQRRLDLIAELEAAGGPNRAAYRAVKFADLAILALHGGPPAAEPLDRLAAGTVPADAADAKAALLLRDWWATPTAESQRGLVDKFHDLAKANPTDDTLARLMLKAARFGAADDEVANGCRDLVEKELKGPWAVAYKASPCKLGRPFVLNGVTMDGKPFSSAQWKGKVVLIDFWATWCPPCRESLPHVVQLYKDQHDKGLEIVGVSNDSSKPDLKQFLVQNKDMAWPQLFGPAPPSGWHALAKKYEVPSIPNYWVIDREGILRISHTNRFPEKQVLALLEPPAKPATRPAAVAKAEPAPAPPTQPPAAPAPPAAAKPTTNPTAPPAGLPSWAR